MAQIVVIAVIKFRKYDDGFFKQFNFKCKEDIYAGVYKKNIYI